jgi:hypothetical protein
MTSNTISTEDWWDEETGETGEGGVEILIDEDEDSIVERAVGMIQWAIAKVKDVYGTVWEERMKEKTDQLFGGRLLSVGRWLMEGDESETVEDLFRFAGENLEDFIYGERMVVDGDYIWTSWQENRSAEENVRELSIGVGEIFNENSGMWFYYLTEETVLRREGVLEVVRDIVGGRSGMPGEWGLRVVSLREIPLPDPWAAATAG